MRQLITIKSQIVRFPNLETETAFNVTVNGEFHRYKKLRDAVIAVVHSNPLDVNTNTRVKLDDVDCGSLWQCGVDPTVGR